MSESKKLNLSRESVIEIETSRTDDGKTSRSTVYSGDVVIIDDSEYFLGVKEIGVGPRVIVLPSAVGPHPTKEKDRKPKTVRFVSLSSPAAPDRFLSEVTLRVNPLNIPSK